MLVFYCTTFGGSLGFKVYSGSMPFNYLEIASTYVVKCYAKGFFFDIVMLNSFYCLFIHSFNRDNNFFVLSISSYLRIRLRWYFCLSVSSLSLISFLPVLYYSLILSNLFSMASTSYKLNSPALSFNSLFFYSRTASYFYFLAIFFSRSSFTSKLFL